MCGKERCWDSDNLSIRICHSTQFPCRARSNKSNHSAWYTWDVSARCLPSPTLITCHHRICHLTGRHATWIWLLPWQRWWGFKVRDMKRMSANPLHLPCIHILFPSTTPGVRDIYSFSYNSITPETHITCSLWHTHTHTSQYIPPSTCLATFTQHTPFTHIHTHTHYTITDPTPTLPV